MVVLVALVVAVVALAVEMVTMMALVSNVFTPNMITMRLQLQTIE